PVSVEFRYLKSLNIDLVFTDELPERAPFFLCCLCSLRYVSSVCDEKTLNVVCFELRDHVRLHFVKRQLVRMVILAGENYLVCLNSSLSAENNHSLSYMFQFTHVAGPAIEHQFAFCFRRKLNCGAI